MDAEVKALAERIWRYHQMGHEVRPADLILVLCSHDVAVAERGAQLFLDGLAPLLAFSGGLGAVTRRFWTEPEAARFAAIARERGVPDERILIENRSTNTAENVAFTRALLASRGLAPERVILVQKPYMERRAYATFLKVWPEAEVMSTSPQVAMEEYLARYSSHELTEHDVISIMVGDLQRIREYAARGFQIPQDIPDDVWDAFTRLVARGYDRHLVRS